MGFFMCYNDDDNAYMRMGGEYVGRIKFCEYPSDNPIQ